MWRGEAAPSISPLSGSKRTAQTCPFAQSPVTSTSWPSASARRGPPPASAPRRRAASGGRRAGRTSSGSAAVWKLGASIASCRSIPKSTTFRKNWSVHWSCWSPPGRPEHHVRLAVLHRQRRRQRRARALAGRERVGVARVEVELLAARPEREAEPGDDRRGRNPAAARRGREHVALGVDHVDVGRVAGVDARVADQDAAAGSAGASPGRSSGGRAARVDQRAPLGPRTPSRAAGRAARRRRPGRRSSCSRSAKASLAASTTVWMYSAELWPSAARSKPSSSVSCCRKTGPCVQGPHL